MSTEALWRNEMRTTASGKELVGNFGLGNCWTLSACRAAPNTSLGLARDHAASLWFAHRDMPTFIERQRCPLLHAPHKHKQMQLIQPQV